jgi:hypothetical protein
MFSFNLHCFRHGLEFLKKHVDDFEIPVSQLYDEEKAPNHLVQKSET